MDRLLKSLLGSVVAGCVMTSSSAALLGTGNPAYYNSAPSFRVATTTVGADPLLTFSFQVLQNVNAGGSIQFAVDTIFINANSPFPANCVKTVNGLVAANANGFQCAYSNGLVSVGNFNAFYANQIVTITLTGFKNIQPPANPPHSPAQSSIRTLDSGNNLLDWSNVLSQQYLPSCTAAGGDCSIGAPAGMQLQTCLRGGVGGQIQYCCPQGSHWTGNPVCQYDTVTLKIDPKNLYGAFYSHPSGSHGNQTFGPVTPNSPWIVESIPSDAYWYGGSIMLQYPAASTGIIYPIVRNTFYNEDGTQITSIGPNHLKYLDLDGYAAIPGEPDAMYGYTVYNTDNVWTDWLFQPDDFPVNAKVRHNMVIHAYADRAWQTEIPVAANSFDVWIQRH